jgi:hypothetical protein
MFLRRARLAFTQLTMQVSQAGAHDYMHGVHVLDAHCCGRSQPFVFVPACRQLAGTYPVPVAGR